MKHLYIRLKEEMPDGRCVESELLMYKNKAVYTAALVTWRWTGAVKSEKKNRKLTSWYWTDR